jgi:hypothetical protein
MPADSIDKVNPPSSLSRIQHDSQDGDSKPSKQTASTGASAASIRAVTARMVAFYFRAPIKAFFRTRVE